MTSGFGKQLAQKAAGRANGPGIEIPQADPQAQNARPPKSFEEEKKEVQQRMIAQGEGGDGFIDDPRNVPDGFGYGPPTLPPPPGSRSRLMAEDPNRVITTKNIPNPPKGKRPQQTPEQQAAQQRPPAAKTQPRQETPKEQPAMNQQRIPPQPEQPQAAPQPPPQQPSQSPLPAPELAQEPQSGVDEGSSEGMGLMDDPYQILATIPGAPDRAVIDQWKKDYGHDNIRFLPLESGLAIIYRPLNHFEYTKQIQAEGLQGAALQDAVLQRCLLYPRLKPEEWNAKPAGLRDFIFEIVMKSSYFLPVENVLGIVQKL